MKIIIVRHAETTENAKVQDLGYNNEALLTEQGIQQAKKLAKKLKHEKITHAYASPQRRAVHTAQELLVHHPDVTIVSAPHLKEQSLGIYETAPKSVWQEFKKKAKEAFHLIKPENGESYTELQKRAAKFFNELIHKHQGDTVLLVSHGGTIGMLLLHIFEKSITEENYKAHKPENTAVTMLEIFNDKPTRIYYINSLEHLDEQA